MASNISCGQQKLAWPRYEVALKEDRELTVRSVCMGLLKESFAVHSGTHTSLFERHGSGTPRLQTLHIFMGGGKGFGSWPRM